MGAFIAQPRDEGEQVKLFRRVFALCGVHVGSMDAMTGVVWQAWLIVFVGEYRLL